METMTPTGKLRTYYKQAWGIDTMRGVGAVPHVLNVLRKPMRGLGLIELSGVTMVGIATGAVATYLWMRPPARLRRSSAGA